MTDTFLVTHERKEQTLTQHSLEATIIKETGNPYLVVLRLIDSNLSVTLNAEQINQLAQFLPHIQRRILP